MKEFFKPNKLKIILSLLWILFIILVLGEILRPQPFNTFGWKITTILFWPTGYFFNFGLWVWTAVNPGVKEISESLEPGFKLISYLIVWPLMLIYIYTITSIISAIWK